MFIIGVTGGIASGKSYVCSYLKEKYKAIILNTDQMAREEMMKGRILYIKVVEYFGEEILADDGEINREKLSQIVFNNANRLQRLNELTHPHVVHMVKESIAYYKGLENKGINFDTVIVVETALAIEAGLDAICNQVWYINSLKEIRTERLIKTRNMSHEKIEAIFKSQAKEEEFIRRGYLMIQNNGTIDELEKKIDEHIRKIKQ